MSTCKLNSVFSTLVEIFAKHSLLKGYPLENQIYEASSFKLKHQNVIFWAGLRKEAVPLVCKT